MMMDTMASGHAQSANKTANKNVGTNIENELTASSRQ
jgi:hypothetical protein